MFSKRADIVIVILLVMAIAMSAFSIFAPTTHDNESFKPEYAMDSVVEIICWDDVNSKAYGTGFITDHNGMYIITNYHMVFSNTADDVKFSNIKAKYANTTTEYDLDLISFDKDNDIAALKFKDHDPKNNLNLRTERPSYGEEICVIGNALGYGLSVKNGVVSVPEINVNNDGITKNCVMISLTINHGDSGSPIIDSDGYVIGMSSFKLKDDGKSVEGMSYGITSRTIVNFMDDKLS